MTTTTVHWGPMALILRTGDRHVRHWFRHLMAAEPGSVATMPANRPVTIDAVVDAVATDAYVRALDAGAAREVEGYRGEYWRVGSVEGRPAWCLGRPSAPLVDRHVVLAEGGGWRVVGRSSGQVATAVVRHAREVVRTGLAVAGAHTLHAAFAHHPRFGGVLFSGPSGAGKTTLALALAAAGGRLVSGDQTEVLPDAAGGPAGVGFPWVFRLGLGTIAGLGRYPAVAAAPLIRRQPAVPGGSLGPRDAAERPHAKAELSFTEVRELLGIACADSAPVHSLVVIQAAGPADGIALQRTSLDDVADLLRPEYREPDPAFANFYLAQPDAQPECRRIAQLWSGLGRVPVFRLRWRAGRDAPAAVLTALEAQLRPAHSA
jgi:hypothetical protein